MRSARLLSASLAIAGGLARRDRSLVPRALHRLRAFSVPTLDAAARDPTLAGGPNRAAITTHRRAGDRSR